MNNKISKFLQETNEEWARLSRELISQHSIANNDVYICPKCGKNMRLAVLDLGGETKGYEFSAWIKCDDCINVDLTIYNGSNERIATGRARGCYEADVEQWRILNDEK